MKHIPQYDLDYTFFFIIDMSIQVTPGHFIGDTHHEIEAGAHIIGDKDDWDLDTISIECRKTNHNHTFITIDDKSPIYATAHEALIKQTKQVDRHWQEMLQEHNVKSFDPIKEYGTYR